MSFWEAVLALNIVMGLLASYYYAKQKGEVLLGDLGFMVVLTCLGFASLWTYFYDEYTKEIHLFLAKARHIGKRPLWRSKSTIAKEVLYGEKK